jgi:catechol 2,3-dioxygenase-like lactoylglutathione lyase family enzyme
MVMAILSLDHVNIRTADVPRTTAFFRDVLGLRADIAPGASSIERGCWIYDAGNRPIVHIGPSDGTYSSDGIAPFTPARGGGSVHHVALECDDYDGMIARLKEAGLAFSENPIPSIGLHQVFVTEANGILLELNFQRD